MNIIERLTVLNDDGNVVTHKALGDVKLENDFDLIRIRCIEEGKTHKEYCKFLHAETFKDSNINQGISDDILNKEIVHEEVWMLSPQISLDMFVNV